MASTRDIHDIMGMGGGPVQKPANKKKKKVIEAQPRLSGISREVQALMGDSVPPVQILETPKYKSKPSLASKLYKPRHWEERTFTPGARGDGLVLRHWKRAVPVQRPAQTNGDVDMIDGGLDKQFEDEFPMEKWAVSVKVPEYTDEQYEKHFNTHDWTREETDYLMQLAADYDLRWIVIADRYDPQDIQPHGINGESTDLVKAYASRTAEQLKKRYYEVAAQDLEMRTPKSTMNPSEFALFEKMRNFDAKTESLRKTMAEKLFERTKDEAEEERTLLEELHRITKNEEDFINMRRDLYARLEAAPSLRRNERGEEQNIVLSSAGLSDLLSRLFAKEKHLKRRIPAPGEAGSATTQQGQEGRGRSNTQISRRDTLDAPSEATKKGSISHQPVPKQLSKADEDKYGVVHSAERLTSGVSFRHEKINRATTAKSQVQTQKINAALTELEIPARLSMPTEKVCREFERLVSQIQLLLDARKTSSRVAEEVKILEDMRRQRLGEPPLADQAGSAVDVDGTDQSQSQAINSESAQTAPGMSRRLEPVDGGPGPAVDDDDEDDAEGEDDVDASNLEQTQAEDDEDQEDIQVNDDSMVRGDVDEEDEEEQEDDENEEAEEEEEQEEEDDDDEGMAALRRGAQNGDDDEEEEEDDDEQPEPLVEEGDEEEETAQQEANSDNAEDDDEEVDERTQDVTMDEVEPADKDPDADVDEEEEEVQESRPTSAGSRGHKRGASVISDASGAGSNRSALGRKRKR